MSWVSIWIVSMFIGAAAGGRHNAAGAGFLLGFFLGPIGAIGAFGLKGDRRACPFCKELIKKAAVKCPKCQSDIPQPIPVLTQAAPPPQAPGPTLTKKQKIKAGLIVLLVFVVGGIAWKWNQYAAQAAFEAEMNDWYAKKKAAWETEERKATGAKSP